jgi:hypothetical protein
VIAFAMDVDVFYYSTMINRMIPGTIDERVMIMQPKTRDEVSENHNLFINSAIGIGCAIPYFSSKDLHEGKVSNFHRIFNEISHKFGVVMNDGIDSIQPTRCPK